MHTTRYIIPTTYLQHTKMFNVYKKIVTPDSSPIIGPTTTSPKDSPNFMPLDDNNATTHMTDNFLLCNYCCASRVSKIKKNNDCIQKQDQVQSQEHSETQDKTHSQPQDYTQEIEINYDTKEKYEFGHATHYTYNSTTPKTLHAFNIEIFP